MKGGNLHGLGIRYVRYSWWHKTVKQSVRYGSTNHFIDCHCFPLRLFLRPDSSPLENSDVTKCVKIE